MASPARWGRRRELLDNLDRVRLARPAVRLYELALATRSALFGKRVPTDGVPLPSSRLRVKIGPLHADAAYFLNSGRDHAELIRTLVTESGSSVDELDAILDFGCGYGRILRHWAGLPRTRVFGCDIDPSAVAWCTTNLAFAEVSTNGLAPPLRYDASSFDLVYAFSVFTHLSEELQRRWIDECRRILETGGLLLFSTLGERYASLDRLTAAERRSFDAGNLVVLYGTSPGTSLCSAYHPHEYVRDSLASDFELVSFQPAAADGHDIHLFRKPAASRSAPRGGVTRPPRRDT
jgi:SAM-dependent methyltransferase